MTHDPFKRIASRTRVNVRARGYAHTGDLTADELRARFALFDNKCTYCGLDDLERLGPDHDIPLARGGLNTIDNIVPACRDCNSKKHTQTGEDFRRTPIPPWQPPPADFSGPLTARELARILQIGVDTVYGWIGEGDLVANNVGAGVRPTWRIEEADAVRFLAKRSTTPPEVEQ